MTDHHTDLSETRSHWNEQASTYDAAKAANSYYYDSLKELYASLLPEVKSMRLLEIGCGTGEILASLAPKSGLGVDISEDMIRIARSKYEGLEQLTFEVSAAEDLSQLNHEFDVVVMCDVLEHVQDVSRTLSEPSAVLRPGGLFLVTTSSPLWAFPLWILEKFKLKMPEGPHKWVPLRSITRQLQESGFEVLKSGTATLIPMYIPLLSNFANRALIRLPLLSRLGLTEYVLARRC